MSPRSRCWPGCGSAPTSSQTFTGQLNSIVDYVAQLQELDTTDVEPLAHGSRSATCSATTFAARHCPARPRWQRAQAEPGELPGPGRARVSEPRSRLRSPADCRRPGPPAVPRASSPGTGCRSMKHATADRSPGPDERRGRHVRRDRPGVPRPGRAARSGSTCSSTSTPSRSWPRPARSTPARKAGEPLGPLAGVPVAIKDVLCVEGEPTTCGSRMLRNFRPPYDATVIARLKAAGAILFGKTNMDEFAMGSSTENSAYGPTRNPWDEERVPGRLVGRLGRGGGRRPGAALARLRHRRLDPPAGGRLRHRRAQADLRPRQPLRADRLRQLARPDRPVRPRPGRRGAAAQGDLRPRPARLDERGRPGARLPGHARHAPRVAPRSASSASSSARASTPRSRRPSARRSGSTSRPGRRSRRSRCPHSKYGIPAYYIVAPAECSSNLARYDGTIYGHRAEDFSPRYPGEEDLPPLVRMMMASRAEGFGAEVKRRIMLGTFALSAGYADQYYNQALKVRRLIRNDFDAAFQEVDVLIGPTSPTAGVQAGRADRRPAGDVPVGHLHDHRQPRRHPRPQHPLRPDEVEPADRPAAPGPGLRRGDAARGRPGSSSGQTDWHLKRPGLKHDRRVEDSDSRTLPETSLADLDSRLAGTGRGSSRTLGCAGRIRWPCHCGFMPWRSVSRLTICKQLKLSHLPKVCKITRSLGARSSSRACGTSSRMPPTRPVRQNWDLLVDFSKVRLNDLRYLPRGDAGRHGI